MGKTTGIEWADATFNPWIGCTPISPACNNCYAEKWSRRFNYAKWGAGEERQLTTRWNKVEAMSRKAGQQGRRIRVFAASLGDIFDNEVPPEWRRKFWDLVAATENLDWLLLTKRPQNINKMLPDHRDDMGSKWRGWRRVYFGTTVENQTEANRRIPVILETAPGPVFLSMEPLLSSVSLRRIYPSGSPTSLQLEGERQYLDPLAGYQNLYGRRLGARRLSWVIAGGETGKEARPSKANWFRQIRDDCETTGTPFFFKQWGEYGQDLKRVGKKKSGRLLDGVEWNQRPEAIDY